MYSIEDKISDISLNKYHYLINLQNVIGVSLGYKYVNRQNTFEPCLNVLVEKKVNSKYIHSNNLIPKTYMGIKTDVLEIGILKQCDEPVLRGISRPLKGGYGISDLENEGTIACIMRKIVNNDLEFFILTNNHILVNNDSPEETPIGNPVYQPSLNDEIINGDFTQNIVGFLSNYIPLKFKNKFPNASNLVDCAIAQILDKSIISNEIALIENLKNPKKANLNDSIKKVGYASGLTNGKVIGINATITANYISGGPIVFTKQIIGELPHLSGDSGSLVLTDLNEPIGLFATGNGIDYAIINDIRIVLYLLKGSIFKY